MHQQARAADAPKADILLCLHPVEALELSAVRILFHNLHVAVTNPVGTHRYSFVHCSEEVQQVASFLAAVLARKELECNRFDLLATEQE